MTRPPFWTPVRRQMLWDHSGWLICAPVVVMALAGWVDAAKVYFTVMAAIWVLVFGLYFLLVAWGEVVKFIRG